ncbi:hypothetical protein RRG08_053153, partial [Elysia crispata]
PLSEVHSDPTILTTGHWGERGPILQVPPCLTVASGGKLEFSPPSQCRSIEYSSAQPELALNKVWLVPVPRSVYCTEYPDQCVVFSTQISVLYRVPSPLPWPDQCIVQSTQPAPMARSVYCTEYPVSVVYMHRVPRSVYCICTEYPDQCVVFRLISEVQSTQPVALPWPDQCMCRSSTARSHGQISVLYRVPSQCSVYAQSTQISVLYMHRVPRSVCCIQYSDQCIVQSTQPAPMARSVYCIEYPDQRSVVPTPHRKHNHHVLMCSLTDNQ